VSVLIGTADPAGGAGWIALARIACGVQTTRAVHFSILLTRVARLAAGVFDLRARPRWIRASARGGQSHRDAPEKHRSHVGSPSKHGATMEPARGLRVDYIHDAPATPLRAAPMPMDEPLAKRQV
jgi:hypothetical protein